jgi:aerobic C4-dicarboxylate transport protein
VALLLGVDRIMDSMRVVTNLLGNCVAVFAVSKWEGALDTDRAKKMLDGEIAFVEEDEADEGKPKTEAPASEGTSQTGKPSSEGAAPEGAAVESTAPEDAEVKTPTK